jgi:hypothetical protein
MSNVLIGIIGVILFIGLALAGALILGDDFRTASSSSQAATLMAQMKQAADAADMRKLKLGLQWTPSITTDFLAPRFLKVEASNPTSLARSSPGDYRWRIQFNNNVYADGVPEPALAAHYVQTVIGPQGDSKARDVCLQIAQTYGATDIQDMTSLGNFPVPALSTGCILANSHPTIFSSIPQYIAYIRMEPIGTSISQASGY